MRLTADRPCNSLQACIGTNVAPGFVGSLVKQHKKGVAVHVDTCAAMQMGVEGGRLEKARRATHWQKYIL